MAAVYQYRFPSPSHAIGAADLIYMILRPAMTTQQPKEAVVQQYLDEVLVHLMLTSFREMPIEARGVVTKYEGVSVSRVRQSSQVFANMLLFAFGSRSQADIALGRILSASGCADPRMCYLDERGILNISKDHFAGVSPTDLCHGDGDSVAKRRDGHSEVWQEVLDAIVQQGGLEPGAFAEEKERQRLAAQRSSEKASQSRTAGEGEVGHGAAIPQVKHT